MFLMPALEGLAWQAPCRTPQARPSRTDRTSEAGRCKGLFIRRIGLLFWLWLSGQAPTTCSG